MSFFRYPGGKKKLFGELHDEFKIIFDRNNGDLEYREPFFGGGSVGLGVAAKFSFRSFWFNDFDVGIASIWSSVLNQSDGLKRKISNFTPSVECFDLFQDELLKLNKDEYKDEVDVAFKKIAIHQISYSGLGTKSGGPLGGRDQNSDYKIDCRWSPDYMMKKIDRINEDLSKIVVKDRKCSNLDFESLMVDSGRRALIYLDPPYYEKGNDLYQHGFSVNDHLRLADCLRKTNHEWILSYDDCDEVRKLYDFAEIKKVKDVSYSITAKKVDGKRESRKKDELIIVSKWKPYVSNEVEISKEMIKVFKILNEGFELKKMSAGLRLSKALNDFIVKESILVKSMGELSEKK